MKDASDAHEMRLILPSLLFAILLTFTASSYAQPKHSIVSERTLDSDGPNQGLSAYELIKAFGGKRPIESPDLYEENHPGKPHIFEDHDEVVGNHFVFVLHRDHDIDRDKIKLRNNRQRNEIKAYDKSEKALKGYQGDTFEYEWKFRLGDELAVSKKFSHVFQLKSVDDGSGTPILTFTARTKRGVDVFETRHSPNPPEKFNILASHPLSEVRGEWISATCRVTYAESGSIEISAKRMRDGKRIFDINVNGVDTWRGTHTEHFVRPKWGLYRSIVYKDSLRAEEENVRFANFVVRKLRKH